MTQQQGGTGWGQQGPQQPQAWPPPPGQAPYGSTKVCPDCNAVIDAGAMACPNCGYGQQVAYGESKSRPLAIFLALLLGSFGVHRFYVGPVSWGIAYLIFFWTGIPGFLAWLEAIYWLTRSDVEWAQKYGGPVRKSNGLAIGCLWVFALIGIIGLLFALIAVPGLLFIGTEISEILSENQL